ncbi:lysine/arginine/ornithine ABC transporter substrate-binding protein [Roseovarius aestuarii]|nr:lysine/arginine/ornithine ABC transporter substrate-binding protein [Roseovarius aestuarii]
MTFKLILTAALGAFIAQGAAAETLRIATEGAYPPFNFVDESGEVKGFDVEIAKALCAEMKADCEIVTQAWDGIIPGLKAGKYDAIVASMSITDKRKKAVDFTDPYYAAGAALVAPKDSDIAYTPEGLEGKTIGVQRATTYANLVEKKFPGATLKTYDTVENHNLDLQAGRLDGVVAQQMLMHTWLENEGGDSFEFKGEAVKDAEYIGSGAGIAVEKGNTELLDALNAALDTIQQNGTYAAINANYFPFSISAE